MGARRGTAGTAVLAGLMALWVLGPAAWLLASERLPAQSLAWVNLAGLVLGAGVPLIVLVTALLTRRRTLAAVAAIALVAANLLLLLIEAPIWTLFTDALRAVTQG